MIDIHAHLCFDDFDSMRENLVKECERTMDAVIVTSARYDEGLCTLRICDKHPKLFPTIGYHPVEGGDGPEKVMELIGKERDKIVGIGEVGLDHHWVKDEKERSRQKAVFSDFIKLAEELEKPLIIHSWDAEEECFRMVEHLKIPVIFHCYSGSRELAEEILKKGFFISFSTGILFSKIHRKLAKIVPLEQMLLETDAPFLSPYKYFQQKGGEMPIKDGFDPKKNYPWNISFSAEKIAEIRKVSTEEVLGKTTENAKRIFGIRPGTDI